MSRLAKKSIPMPSGVEYREEANTIVLKGANGEVRVARLLGITVSLKNSAIMVKAAEGTDPAAVGTVWSEIRNALEGVTVGFKKVLELEGVGYKAALEGKTLVLSLGFVHPVRVDPPEGIVITVEKNVITVSGIDKQLVGQLAAFIRSQKKPEPYKGKGIHYLGEVIRRKVGKKAGAVAT